MPRIPFPEGFVGVENIPRTRRSLQNLFNNLEGSIISRPGISELNTTARVARGQFVWNGALYQVASTDLLKITNAETGAFSVIGTIAGNAVVETDIGFNDAVIVVKAAGGAIYTLSNSSVIVAIASVGDNGGIAKFNYSGDAITLPGTVTITGFVTNTSYNVSDTSVTSTQSAISTTTIDSVSDSGGIASFVHSGASPSLGASVTIVGYTTNTDYNTTGIVTATTPTSFEISTIPFGTDEAGGSYTALANFEISSISFGSDEATGSYVVVLTDISNNANFVPCTDVAHINGRFVYIPFDGDPAFFSDVGAAGTVQASSFFDAEELPDLNNAVFNFKNTLYITGTDSIERFRDTGASPVPFARVQGGRITNGYIGGLIEYNETFVFLGREKDQDFGIYAIGAGAAPKLSNETIDLVLSTYSQEELAAAIGGRLKWRGYDIFTMTLARDSFGFYKNKWFVLDTVVDGVSKPWRAGFITQFEGQYFTAFSDKIGVFAKVNNDYGSDITRIIDAAFEQEDNDFFVCQSIDLGISQGFNSTEGTVGLFLSRNNVTYGDPQFRDLGSIGDYADHLTWNPAGGMGAFDGFMGIRIYTTQDIEFSANHLIANFRG